MQADKAEPRNEPCVFRTGIRGIFVLSFLHQSQFPVQVNRQYMSQFRQK